MQANRKPGLRLVATHLDPETRGAIFARAAENERSVSAEIRRLVKRYLAESPAPRHAA
jgi:plasmid stability protein